MKNILKKLETVASSNCVTILLQTHRTSPDNDQDPILLKNLVRDAETRLLAELDKKEASPIIEKIKTLAASIDHKHNLETLVLFVNENIAEYVRLPIQVENRVVIDETFATRDLMRALNSEYSYYVLVLDRDKARLIEAYNNKVTREVKIGFPIDNKNLYPSQRSEAAIGARQSNLQREFFNNVDKKLVDVLNEKNLPVIIHTEESNYAEYLKVSDRKEAIVGNVSGNRISEKEQHIIDEVWPTAKDLNEKRKEERIAELKTAASTTNFLTDYNEIWTALESGNGKTIFVQRGFFQPAKIDNGSLELVSQEDATKAGVVDDIIDEMIEKILSKGGDVVFLDTEDLKDYQGLVLITRY